MPTVLGSAGEPSGKPRRTLWKAQAVAFLTFLLLAHPGVIYLIHPTAKIRLLDASVSLASVMVPSP